MGKVNWMWLGVLLASPAVYAAGDAEKGKASYAVCMTCHGQNGEGNAGLNAPAIAGQEEWYLARQLKYFKAGVRGAHADDVWGKTMAPMAATLADDAAVDNVAAYVAAMEPVKPEASVEGGDAAKGATLYGVCVTCHGQNGEGNLALNAPKLTGMQDWYQVRQLQNFKSGVRGAHADDVWGKTMAPMAATLADEQAMKDVVAHIQTFSK